jgi:uncharacterized membrane protein
MELDDFKNIFREKTQVQSSKTKEEIEKLCHAKTTTALEKIMRNMVIEIIFSFIIGIALAVWVLSIKTTGLPLLVAVSAMIIVFVQAALFYPSYMKFKGLQNNNAENLILWISELIITLESFIKAYRRYITWGIPVGGLLGAFIGISDNENELDIPTLSSQDHDSSWLFFIITLAFAAFLFYLAYQLAYYTIRKLYSKYLDELKSTQAELLKEN